MTYRYKVQVFDIYTNKQLHQFSVNCMANEFRKLMCFSSLLVNKVHYQVYDIVDDSYITFGWIDSHGWGVG